MTRSSLRFASFLIGVVFSATPAFAQADARYTLLIPEIPGTSDIRGADKHIDVTAFSLGCSNPTSTVVSGTGGTAKVSCFDVYASLPVRTETVDIFLALVTGKIYSDVTLYAWRQTATGWRIAYFVKFGEVAFTSLNQGGSTGSEVLQSLSFGFAKITIGVGGGPDSNVPQTTWDLATNTAGGGRR